MTPEVTLVISFYNKIEYLKMILAALERQSFSNFEVIIADDGSKQEVVQEIRNISKESPLKINHVWHEDLGFRKTRILNESIRQSTTNYLIFIDGDCIPHHKFIEEHYKNKEDKMVLAGRRVNLSERISLSLKEEKIREGYLEKWFILKLIVDELSGGSKEVVKGIYVQNVFVRRFLNRSIRGVLGCNFSIHKKDLLDINGFDERYQAPAVGEDTDVELRLSWNNVKVKMVKNMAIQYHIYHKKLSRPSENQEILRKVMQEKKAFTPFGILKG
jgi:glycosyltransferase involved in cell wall biosynthesis